MSMIVKFLVAGVFVIFAVCAIIYRIDQPEISKRDHAGWWGAVFFVVALAIMLLL